MDCIIPNNIDSCDLCHLYDSETIKKAIFIYNALQSNWIVYKKNDLYIFKKKHHNKPEVFSDKYLSSFIENCCKNN